MDDVRNTALRFLFELAEKSACECWVCVLLRIASSVGKEAADEASRRGAVEVPAAQGEAAHDESVRR